MPSCHRAIVASWGHAAGTTEPHNRETLQDAMGFRTLADMACDSRTQCNRDEVAVILRLPNTIGYSQGCRSLVSPERNRLLTLGCCGLAFPLDSAVQAAPSTGANGFIVNVPHARASAAAFWPKRPNQPAFQQKWRAI